MYRFFMKVFFLTPVLVMGENFLTKKKEEKEKKILEVRPQKSNVECESQRSF